jgi:imidazolonepropionase
VPTFLGAHDIPPEFDQSLDPQRAYIDLIINEMLPIVKKEKLAEFVDIFLEKGYFEEEQAMRLLNAARTLHLKRRIHADEF